LAGAHDGHVPAYGRLAHVGAELFDQALPGPVGGVALFAGMARSSSSHRSTTGFQRSIFGAARAGTFLGGGRAEANAWRTSRR